MKSQKFQQIRVRVNAQGESVRFTANTDKLFRRVKGIHVSMPADALIGNSG